MEPDAARLTARGRSDHGVAARQPVSRSVGQSARQPASPPARRDGTALESTQVEDALLDG